MRSSARNRLAAVLLALAAAAPAVAADPSAERGAYVFRAANCFSCHTAKDGPPLAGGRPLETPFGVFFSSNVTPDAETGIGGWSEADFERALRQGVGPDGRHYYPVFPYPSFTGMSDQDVRDLWAYLRTVPPVRRENQPHAVGAPYGWRWTLAGWKWLNFHRGPLVADPQRSEAWNRGRYLVQALGHCGECHTPRDRLGGPVDGMALAGTPVGAEGRPAPNVTPDEATGIGEWSKGDLTFFLESGFMPDGDVAGGLMGEVITNSTRHLTPEDRAAMAEYLLSLPPVRNRVERPEPNG